MAPKENIFPNVLNMLFNISQENDSEEDEEIEDEFELDVSYEEDANEQNNAENTFEEEIELSNSKLMNGNPDSLDIYKNVCLEEMESFNHQETPRCSNIEELISNAARGVYPVCRRLFPSDSDDESE